jgi:hypothetical protein
MKPKVKLRIVVGVVFTLLSFFSVPIVSVWKKSRVQEMVTANAQLKERQKSLQGEIVVLDYTLCRLKARERIESLAKNECGLIFPENRAVTVVIRPRESAPKITLPALFGAAAVIR